MPARSEAGAIRLPDRTHVSSPPSRRGEGAATLRLHAVERLAGSVEAFFSTPVAPRYGQAAPQWPDRLVYLLDHEYTQKSLGWDHLKNADQLRAAALHKHLKWLPGEFTRHWLITGDTGVGKTTSGFNPLLHQISLKRPNWGGLILGAKGDEHFFAMEHAAGHGRPEAICVLAVRPDRLDRSWEPMERYNLVSDPRLPYTTHAKNLVDTGASLTEGEQSSFFKPAAQQALTSAFELLETLGKPVNVLRAYEMLTDSSAMEAIFEELLNADSTPERIKLAKI